MEIFVAFGLGCVLLLSYVALIWFPSFIVSAIVQLVSGLFNRLRRRTLDAETPTTIQTSSTTGSLRPHRSSARLSQGLHWLVTFSPVPLFLALSCLKWRAKTLIGYWPQAMVDDPKWIGQNDLLYQRFYDLTDLAFAFAGCSIVAWLVLFVALYSNYEPQQRRIIYQVYTSAWMLALVGTGNGIEWYMD